MTLMTRSLDQASLVAAGARARRPASMLGAALFAGAAGCGLIAWNLESLLSRYDTLSYLLRPTESAALLRLRLLLLAAALGWAVLGAVALFSWRVSLALLGSGLLLSGVLAGPLARVWLAPATGLQESLIYRVRGFAAIGIIGGAYLLFLSWLPGLLDRPAGRWERGVAGLLRGGLERLRSTSPVPPRIVIGILAFIIAAAIGLVILQDFPNSSDEYSYLAQARIFAAGRLWVETPPHPEFFLARSFVMDPESGRLFAKAFPGWAAILSLGVRAGIPWAVNPLLSAVTLILAGWVGRRLLGRGGEAAMVGIIAVTPFFLLNAASYYNHPATLLLITLVLAAVIRLAEGAGIRWAILAGIACGAALWIRPLPALALTLPFGLWLGLGWVRQGRWNFLGAAGAPVIVSLAGLAGYNRLMFGSIWLTGYAAYDRGDIRFGLGADHLAATGWWLLKLCFWLVPGLLAGLWLLLRGRRWRQWFRREPIPVLMLIALALLVVSYLLLQNKGGNEYGPRYYYDGLTYLALLLAAGWMRAPEALEGIAPAERVRRGTTLALACGVLLTVAGAVPFLMFHYQDKVAHNRDLFVTMERSGLPSALVFLATGSGRMPPGDLMRNPPDFRSGVVYARDLGPQADLRLAALYPDRPALVYSYDPLARRSTLRPLAGETGR
jgi:hypothetical protein